MNYTSYIVLGLIIGWSIIELIKRSEKGESFIQQELKEREKLEIKKQHDLIKKRYNLLSENSDPLKLNGYEKIVELCTARDELNLVDLEECVIEIQVLYRNQFNEGPKYKSNFPENVKFKLSPINSYDILAIINEGLHNAASHSNATYITSIMSIENEAFKIINHDTGKGFDQKKVENGNGLGTIKNIVENNQGTIHLTSNENGTIVNVSIPFSSLNSF